ncbi:unnamed protein product [Sphagnum balticum]
MPYDVETVTMFRMIPKRFWDKTFQSWSFPLAEYDTVRSWFLARCDVKLVVCNQDVIMWCIGHDGLAIKLSSWMDKRSALMEIQGMEYDQASGMYNCSQVHTDRVARLFKESNMTVLTRKIKRQPILIKIA